MKAEKAPHAVRQIDRIAGTINLMKEDLFGRGNLVDKLHRIAEGVVDIFDADSAMIWLVRPGDICTQNCIHATAGKIPQACQVDKRCLHLTAGSGGYFQNNGFLDRVPFDHYPIGSIATGSDSGHIVRDAAEDPGIFGQKWAESLKHFSLAAYPLITNKKLPIGVLACFSRQAITPDDDTLLGGLSLMTSQIIQIERELESLRDSERKYRDLFEHVSDFLYSHDLDGNFIEANLAIRTAFGFSEEEMRHLNVKELMPERYRKDFTIYMGDILQRGKGEGLMRVVTKDGSERIVEYKNSVILGPEGPVGIRGSGRDITESIIDKRRLAGSEERFQQVVENAQEWVWEMDSTGLYVYANSAVEKILGYWPDEIATIKYFYDFFLPQERESFKQFAFRSFEKKEKFRERIYRNIHKNGGIVWLSTSGVPILDSKGHLLGYRGVTADITRQKKTESELMRMSYFDALTGIANRRYFEDIARREWRRAVREESPFSLLMVDIDFFKNYNDTYGHLAGDDCLRKVAAVLKEKLKRPGDMIARYGGEEFVILLPDTDAKNATIVAESLRSSIESLKIEHIESYISDMLTISVGVACILPNEKVSLSVLISNADRALYRVKKAGRNRVGCIDLMNSST